MARARPISGKRRLSSGPFSRAVSASRKGWNKALLLAPVACFILLLTISPKLSHPGLRWNSVAAAVWESDASATTGSSGPLTTCHESLASDRVAKIGSEIASENARRRRRRWLIVSPRRQRQARAKAWRRGRGAPARRQPCRRATASRMRNGRRARRGSSWTTGSEVPMVAA